MSALFSPITLRGLTLPNRIMVAPMCQYSAEDGAANDWHFTHLDSLALSGAGAVLHRGDRGGSDRPHHAGLPRAVERRHRGRAAAGPGLGAQALQAAIAIQLAHAGRKASSHKPWDGGKLIPVAEGGWLPEGALRRAAQGERDAAARARRGRAHARPRRLRGGGASAPSGSASTPSRCTARTAICCTSSSRRSPTAAPTATAAASRTACAFRSKSSRRCARRFPRQAGRPAGLRHRLGRGRLGSAADHRLRA